MFLIITIIFATLFKCFNSSHTHPPTNSEPAVKLATRKQNICLKIFSRWKYQPSSTPWSRKLVFKVYFVQDVLHIIKRNWNVFQLFTSVASCDPYLWRRARFREVAWQSVQRVGCAIRRSRPLVRVQFSWVAGFVHGRPELKSSVTLVHNQLVAFCQLEFLIVFCYIQIISLLFE